MNIYPFQAFYRLYLSKLGMHTKAPGRLN